MATSLLASPWGRWLAAMFHFVGASTPSNLSLRASFALRRWSASVSQALIALVLVVGLASPAEAQRAFAQRASFNDTGDIRMIGNKLLTCTDGTGNDAGCPLGAPNAGTQNANRNMVFVNVNAANLPAGVPANSSSADLPATLLGSNVLFAGLYWGARSNVPAPDTRGTIRMRVPGSTTYATVTALAANLDTIPAQANIAAPLPYQAFADVTGLVQAAGGGTYFVGGLTAATGVGDGLGLYGGWSLVVIIKDATEPFRRLMVFDGTQVINASTVDVTVTGILTPATGTFTTRAGAVVWEGDDGITGDAFQISRLPAGPFTSFSNGLNLATNFWNSSITRLGVAETAKNPNHVNQMALDVDYLDAPAGVLQNSDTQATLRFTTTGDVYFPHALTFAVDLFVPNLATSITKTAAKVGAGPIAPGDTIRYTVGFTNTGGDGATNVVMTDPIPANATYSPGTLNVVTNATGATTGVMSDAAGDDIAEFLTGPPRVVFRLGTGANATNGGLIPPNQAASMTFDVTVNAGVADGTVITNTASVVNNSQTLGNSIVQNGSRSASSTVQNQANLAITKTDGLTAVAAGGTVTYTIVVSNAGPQPAGGAVFKDPPVANLTVTAVSCGLPTGSAVCPTLADTTVGIAPMQGAAGLVIPTLPSGGSVTFTVVGTAGASGSISNTATIDPPSGVVDPVLGNNTATDVTAILIAPTVTKAFSPTSGVVGAPTQMTIQVTNPAANTVAITGGGFTDNYPTGLTNAVGASVTITPPACGGTASVVSSTSLVVSGLTIAVGGTCSIVVNSVQGNTQGPKNNNTGPVTSTNAATSPGASATYTALAPAALTVTKTVTAGPTATGTANQYSITYQLDVVNSGGVAGAYQLDDTPHFGSGVTLAASNNATCASSVPVGTGPADITPCTAAPATITLTNGAAFNIASAGTAINVGTTHRYTIVATFTVVPASVLVSTNGAGCSTATPPTSDTGLNNTATLTPTGVAATTSNDCRPTPPALVVAKGNPTISGTTATYSITVTNTGGAGSYLLQDTPLFGAGITVGTATCTSGTPPNTAACPTAGPANLPGATPWTLAPAGTAIAAATGAASVVHTFTVAIPFVVTGASTPASRTCVGGNDLSNAGLNNRADLTAAGSTTTDPGCTDSPTPANVNHSKVLGAGPTLTAPNTYTQVYTITVNNTGGTASGYGLNDSPLFGAGTTVTGASCVASGTGAASCAGVTGVAASYVVAAAPTAIVAGGQHVYTITVTFTVNPALTTANDSDCSLTTGSTTNTGLLNRATMTPTGGSAIAQDACTPLPPAVSINKRVVSGGNSNSPVVYEVKVTNTGGTAGTYRLTDTPNFGSGIAVAAAPTCTNTSNPAGGGAPTCTGTTGPWELAAAGTVIAASTAAGGATVHTYLVSVPFSVDAGVPASTASSRDCIANDGAGVTATGLTNTATATIVGGGSPSSTACAPVTGSPSISVTKIAGVPTVAAGAVNYRTDAGDTVAYTFDIKNTGNVDLTNVILSDTKLASLSCAAIPTLLVGQTVTATCTGNVYTLLASDLTTGSVTNVVTATGTAPPAACVSGQACSVTNSGTATVTLPSALTAGISVTKLANPGVFTAAGNVIAYTILVENTSQSVLSNVVVTDPKANPVTCPGGGNTIASLPVNGSVTCTASYTVLAADVTAGRMTNVATATGVAPSSTCANPPCTVSDSGTTTVVLRSNVPEITVVKQATPKTISTLGQLIDYTIVGTNTGNVPLTNVAITDTKVPSLTCVPGSPVSLSPGQSITCTGVYPATAADLTAGKVVNIATGVGTPPSGPPVSSVGTATVPVVPIANDDFGSTTLNAPVTLPISNNDQYPPGSTVLPSSTSTNGGTIVCTPAAPTSTPANCRYTPPPGFVGTDTYTYRLCLPAPNGAVCDDAIVTITIDSSDMAVAIIGLPTSAGPGAVLNGRIDCTNTSTVTTATNPTCNATAGTPTGATVNQSACTYTAGSSATSVLAGGVISCPISVMIPANQPDSQVLPTTVGVNATTSADNDNNPANNSDSKAIGIVDAVNDSTTVPFGTAGTLSVLSNDEVGAAGATSATVSISQVAPPTTGSTFDLTTGIFSVPAAAAPGVYTVRYTICAKPAATPNACDTADATITVGPSHVVSGTVVDDGNGLTDLAISGSGTNAGGLTAYLVNSSTLAVVFSAPVSPSGTFIFPSVANGTYNVVISATAGQTNNPTTNLPTNWVTVGEGTGSLPDGTADGRIMSVVVSDADRTGMTFAIEQRPIAGGSTMASQPNPGGTVNVPVPASAFQTGTSDADGTVTSYTITSFPANVTSITINGTVYGGSGVPFPAAGVTVPAANIGSVSIDPIDGAVTVSVAFTVNDNAGFGSGNAGAVVVPFSLGTADLAVQKNGPAAVQAGAQIVYSVTLINNGLSAANGATFLDTLPPGLTNVTAICSTTAGFGTSACSAIPLSVSGSSISGSIPGFPSGGSVVLTIRATAPATGPITNTVTVTPPTGVIDPIPGNNSSSVTTAIGTPPLEADVSVIKTGPASVSPLGAISYVVDVVNGGPSAANGASFTDVPPATVTGISWTCVASGQAVCPAASGVGVILNQTIAVFPMNGRLRYTINGTAAASAAGSSIVNTATVSPPIGVTDPNPNNNSSTVTTNVPTTPPTVANLSMSKVGPATVLPGGIVRYTMVATNNGPAAANGAIVSDVFPNAISNVTWTCSASVGATCGAASGSGNLSMTLPTFAAASQVTFVVTSTAPNSGTFQNSSRVAAPPTVFDPDPTDNIGGPVITTVILAPADLVTTVVVGTTACPNVVPLAKAKEGSAGAIGPKCVGDAPVPGQSVTATVTMGNIGPSPAGNVTVTLRIPPGSTAVVPSGGGVYNPATNTITWPLIAFVPPSTNPVISYTVSFVPPATGGTLRSDVVTPDTEVTLTNNPDSKPLQVITVVTEPEIIPVVPWWLIALMLAFVGRRGLRSVNQRRV